MKQVEILIPDIGDFKEVEIIEVLVKEGEKIEQDEDLLTLESDKATMGIPAPSSGKIKSLTVKVGDKVSQGSLIGYLEVIKNNIPNTNNSKEHIAKKSNDANSQQNIKVKKDKYSTQNSLDTNINNDFDYDLVVLGAGPGGYTAAFRGADLGLKTAIVEYHANLGGVCLNVGCIPSKTYLHIAQVLMEIKEIAKWGVDLNLKSLSSNKICAHKNNVVGKLTQGLAGLAKQRKISIIQGHAHFINTNSLQVTNRDGNISTISFKNIIIAAGSTPNELPNLPFSDSRIMDSTQALELNNIPKSLLIIGGGIIGIELGQVYNSFGTKVTLLNRGHEIISECDADITKPLMKRLEATGVEVLFNSQVSKANLDNTVKSGLEVEITQKDGKNYNRKFDKVLVAIGRYPNGHKLGLENIGVTVDEKGYIQVNKMMQTNVPNIYAIGDIIGQPMLAHKAVHEGKVAAENIAGMNKEFNPKAIPCVAYTDPEIAWTGKLEKELQAQGIEYEKGIFPWAASGRSLSLGRSDGITKSLFDKKTKRLLGTAIVGTNAGELIAEATLAIEMGADMEDIGLTIHPHPTLSETFAFAAEMAEGTITDLISPNSSKQK